jgi:hypothetical protein
MEGAAIAPLLCRAQGVPTQSDGMREHPASVRRASGGAGRRAASMAFSVRSAVRRSRALALPPCAVMPTC